MLYRCSNATKLNYFDGSKAGFGIFIIILLLFPVGQYERHTPFSLCTAVMLIWPISRVMSFDYFTFSQWVFSWPVWWRIFASTGTGSFREEEEELVPKWRSWLRESLVWITVGLDNLTRILLAVSNLDRKHHIYLPIINVYDFTTTQCQLLFNISCEDFAVNILLIFNVRHVSLNNAFMW